MSENNHSVVRIIGRIAFGVITFFSMLISPFLLGILSLVGIFAFAYGFEFFIIIALYLTLLGYTSWQACLLWIVGAVLLWCSVEFIKARLLLFAR